VGAPGCLNSVDESVQRLLDALRHDDNENAGVGDGGGGAQHNASDEVEGALASIGFSLGCDAWCAALPSHIEALTVVLPPTPSSLNVVPFHALPIDKTLAASASSYSSSSIGGKESSSNNNKPFRGRSICLGDRFVVRVSSSLALHAMVEAQAAAAASGRTPNHYRRMCVISEVPAQQRTRTPKRQGLRDDAANDHQTLTTTGPLLQSSDPATTSVPIHLKPATLRAAAAAAAISAAATSSSNPSSSRQQTKTEKKHAGVVEERRYDPYTYAQYTIDEFWEYYGGTEEWENAYVVEQEEEADNGGDDDGGDDGDDEDDPWMNGSLHPWQDPPADHLAPLLLLPNAAHEAVVVGGMWASAGGNLNSGNTAHRTPSTLQDEAATGGSNIQQPAQSAASQSQAATSANAAAAYEERKALLSSASAGSFLGLRTPPPRPLVEAHKTRKEARFRHFELSLAEAKVQAAVVIAKRATARAAAERRRLERKARKGDHTAYASSSSGSASTQTKNKNKKAAKTDKKSGGGGGSDNDGKKKDGDDDDEEEGDDDDDENADLDEAGLAELLLEQSMEEFDGGGAGDDDGEDDDDDDGEEDEQKNGGGVTREERKRKRRSDRAALNALLKAQSWWQDPFESALASGDVGGQFGLKIATARCLHFVLPVVHRPLPCLLVADDRAARMPSTSTSTTSTAAAALYRKLTPFEFDRDDDDDDNEEDPAGVRFNNGGEGRTTTTTTRTGTKFRALAAETATGEAPQPHLISVSSNSIVVGGIFRLNAFQRGQHFESLVHLALRPRHA